MPFPVTTLQNLMQFNDTLLDGITLPQGASLDYMKYAILFNYGEMQVLYPDWSVFRFYAENWFASHMSQLQHLYNDWEANYNPVYNKDGYFEETRTPNLLRSKTSSEYADQQNTRNRNLTSSGSENTTENPGAIVTESGSTTEQYKGFNSSAFNDVSKELPGKVSTASGTNTGNRTNSDTAAETDSINAINNKSGTENESETGTESISRHEYGNIGVTMASQMLRDDRSFWETFAFYDVAAKLFAVDNLVMIY